MCKHILIIEPSRTIRTLLSIYFQNAGHQVMLLSDYKTARQVLPTFKNELPDMVFVAVHPNQTQCYQVLGHLRNLRLTANITLVALVRQDDSTHRQLPFILDIVGAKTLLKPFRIQDAMELITPTRTPVAQRVALS